MKLNKREWANLRFLVVAAKTQLEYDLKKAESMLGRLGGTTHPIFAEHHEILTNILTQVDIEMKED